LSQQNQSSIPEKPRTRWLLRGLAAAVIFLSLLIAAGFSIKGRALVGPDWVQAAVAERLNAALPELDLQFREVEFLLEQDWRPRLSVRDVTVRTPAGEEIVSVSRARARFDLEALMSGRLALADLALDGVFLTLERRPDGILALSAAIGEQGARREAPDLATLISDLDEFLLRPVWRPLTEARIDALTLRYDDGRADRSWLVDGARLLLRRDAQDIDISVDLALLGGSAEVATLTANYAGQIGQRASQFGVTINNLAAADIASQAVAFSWLQALDAPISGALRGGVGEEGGFEPLAATLQIGAGVIQPRPEAKPLPVESARSYFTYFPDEQLLRFDALSVDTAMGRGTLNGEARLAGEQGIDGFLGQFALSEMTVNPGEFYAEPVSLETAQMDFRLSLQPFLLEVGRLEVNDGGSTLTLSGEAAAGPTGWEIAVDAQMDRLSPERLVELWPLSEGLKTRRWLVENLKAGRLMDLNAALRLREGARAPHVYLGFDFAEVEARFMRHMPPLRRAQGHVSLADDRFVLVVDEGGVDAEEGGFVDLAGTSFIVPDVRAKEETPGVVRLAARSSLTAALSMLDQPPLQVMRKAEVPVAVAEGEVELTGTLALPLVRGVAPERVAFHMDGTLRDLRSTRLIPDRTLEASRLAVEATQDSIDVRGRGMLDGVPFDASWRQPLGQAGTPRSRLTGTAVLSQAALAAFNVDLPPGTVTGEATATFDIALEKGAPPVLALRSDLVGAALSVPALGWRKAANQAGTLALDARLGPVPQVDRLVLDAPGLEAEGTVSLTDDRKLDRAALSRLRIGRWLDASMDLVGRGAGQAPAIALRGGRFDLRTAPLAQGGGGGERVPLTGRLDRLQLSDTIALDGLAADLTIGGGLRGTFSGRVNGQAPIQGEVAPQEGRTAVRIISRNAGAVMAAAGALRQARGGVLELLLEPVGSGGAFDGRLRVTDLRIVEAPTMAAILNGISVVGLINELNGDGIFFSEVYADFRLSPNRVTILTASAEGASMGLSLDGLYQTDTGAIQFQGVISPVYALNRIGSAFTRAGEGLFAFNYSIGGTVQNPRVSVNPLSVLAPGGLRNIFRRPTPDAPRVDGETRTPRPNPEPTTPRVVTPGGDR
jgi:hypothetical protein